MTTILGRGEDTPGDIVGRFMRDTAYLVVHTNPPQPPEVLVHVVNGSHVQHQGHDLADVLEGPQEAVGLVTPDKYLGFQGRGDGSYYRAQFGVSLNAREIQAIQAAVHQWDGWSVHVTPRQDLPGHYVDLYREEGGS